MIPLYILGLLLRFGPQHGYQIKKLLQEQMEDFTRIKLPTVYYHLEKMEAAGLIIAKYEKSGTRPEKIVYCVSDSGAERFKELLAQSLQIEYRPTFDIDGALFFSDALESNALTESLSRHITKLKQIIIKLKLHQEETIRDIPEQYKIFADTIFCHHLVHYEAELTWAEQSYDGLKEAEKDEKI